MQTFLPYPSFARSAAVLDDRRLGKQRVEVLQILRALHLEGYGWAHHPAVLMWRGHTRALVAYGLAVVVEWTTRGFGDTTRGNIVEFTRPRPAVPADRLPAGELPPWLGRRTLHRSHQAALVRKDPAAYGAAFPAVDPALAYVWPPPPAGPPAARPFSAWVVRPGGPETLAAFLAGDFVGVPVALCAPGATPKQRRQAERLRAASSGARVAVLDGDQLHCGRFTDATGTREVEGVTHVTRALVWDRTVARSALRRPYQLQDPQAMFALRGEPAVRAPVGTGGAGSA